MAFQTREPHGQKPGSVTYLRSHGQEMGESSASQPCVLLPSMLSPLTPPGHIDHREVGELARPVAFPPSG